MKEHEVARCTFGLTLKVAGPSFYIQLMFAQRPDFCKNFVMANSSHFYEFGTQRSRGRSKKHRVLNHQKLMLWQKKNIYLKKSLLTIRLIILMMLMMMTTAHNLKLGLQEALQNLVNKIRK